MLLVFVSSFLGLMPSSQLIALAKVLNDAPSPATGYSSFDSAPASVTGRLARSLLGPLSQAHFIPPRQTSSLLQDTVKYTTYALRPGATDTADDGPFGQSAYNALWEKISYSAGPPFTTTVAPTPVASSELVFPPPLPVQPLGDDLSLKFPLDFVWGVGTSAWQMEGGLQVEGRGPSALDMFGAVGSRMASTDANTASMHYFMYKQDIARLAALGVPHYAFSIAWTRVVPFGTAGSPVNQAALDHYADVIDTCYRYGVTPIVTLLHNDPPQGLLSDVAGFPQHFLYYAKVVMAHYGQRVPIWVTINDANLWAPVLTKDGSIFAAQLRAHAQIYRWYKDELHGTGKVTIKLANNLALPLEPQDPSHVQAAQRVQDFTLGVHGNPLFLGKQIPQSVLETPHLNLGGLTDQELAYMNNTADVFALTGYTAQFAAPPPGGYEACAADPSHRLWPVCATLTSTRPDGWLMSAVNLPSFSSLMGQSDIRPSLTPQYVRQHLRYVWDVFRPAGGIMVTEFGLAQIVEAETPLALQQMDFERSVYFQTYLSEVLKAIHLDGVPVVGALAWSAWDGYEVGGFKYRFGLQSVNVTSNRLERRYKRSFFDLCDFINQHKDKAMEADEGPSGASVVTDSLLGSLDYIYQAFMG
jgi:beta-glucosidase/6-phospho-beta-glucosidase/beta-galactosidase